MKFRSVPKVRLQIDVPVPVYEEIRRRIYVERKPRNVVATELLCAASGLSPEAFGLVSGPSDPGQRAAS